MVERGELGYEQTMQAEEIYRLIIQGHYTDLSLLDALTRVIEQRATTRKLSLAYINCGPSVSFSQAMRHNTHIGRYYPSDFNQGFVAEHKRRGFRTTKLLDARNLDQHYKPRQLDVVVGSLLLGWLPEDQARSVVRQMGQVGHVVLNQEVDWMGAQSPQGTALHDLHQYTEDVLNEARSLFDPNFGSRLPALMTEELQRPNTLSTVRPMYEGPIYQARLLLSASFQALIVMTRSIGWEEHANMLDGLLTATMQEMDNPIIANQDTIFPNVYTVVSEAPALAA